ncbi:transketolase [Chlamydia abortus]|nr:transketolase [Chlamydia abortus]
MKIPAIHIYSHDSYQVGGDGPTHQPYDQLPMLRAIENVKVIRPCDESETYLGLQYALNQNTNQIAFITCRQSITSFNVLDKEFKPAYIIKKANDFDLSILASGSEVELAFKVVEELKHKKIKAQIISVPLLQDLVNNEKLIKQLNISKKPIFALEASSDSV